MDFHILSPLISYLFVKKSNFLIYSLRIGSFRYPIIPHMSHDIHHDHRTAPRIFVDSDLSENRSITIAEEQSHYLLNVMRLKSGDIVHVFNGRDGEWCGNIGNVTKRSTAIDLHELSRRQKTEPDLWLCCAPIKKAHFEYMIEKATELGVSVIQPVLTAHTQIREVNPERCRMIAIEAAEQSERLSVPEIHKPATLQELVAHWPPGRSAIVCAEHGHATPINEAMKSPVMKTLTKGAIVTGPEGGFASEELEALRKIQSAVFVRLGPRILRADTAVIAALSCWQAICGDWADTAFEKSKA